MAPTRRLAAVMFTDLAGYTELTHTDESEGLRLIQEQEKLTHPIFTARHGRHVKSMGDGLLIEFPNALDAVECAVDLQRAILERNSRTGSRPLRMRVGIHLGDVEQRGTDIFGDAVNIASRVEPLAEPGGVCVSEPVYDQVHNKVAFRFDSLGSRGLKGVPEPIHVYRVVLPWTTAEPPPEATQLPRLAVLPLANISPDPKDEYFADGLTEELISVLSQIRGLRVIARTSVNQYKATSKPVSQIGSELGVTSLLEGSVRKAGNRLRISLQLVDVASQEHLWSESYNRDLEDVFAIQAEVAEQTAGALKLRLLKSEREAIEERPTSSLAAYEYYLRGIEASRRVSEVEAREAADREAVSYFEAALREDPQFSAAAAYLANHFIAVLGVTRPAREVAPRARELVAQALKLNPNSSEAHTAGGNLAIQVDLDWAGAESEFQQAIALNPSSSRAHFWYAYLLGTLQRFKEAEKQYLVSIEQDPLWLTPRRNRIWIRQFSGDLDGAIEMWEELAARFRDDPLVLGALGWAYALAGRADDAVQAVEALADISDPSSRWGRARVLAVLGRPEEVRALIADWEGGRLSGYFSPPLAASMYALVGESDKALALLEQDYRGGDKLLWNLYQDEGCDPIREDPRFIALLRAMSLPTKLARPLRVKEIRSPA